MNAEQVEEFKNNIMDMLPVLGKMKKENLDSVLLVIGQTVDLNDILSLASIVVGMSTTSGIVETSMKEAEENRIKLVNKACKVIEQKMGDDGTKIVAVLKGVMGMMNGDIAAIKDIATQMGKFDISKVEKIVDSLNK